MADCADTEPNYGLPATMAGKPFSHYVCGTLDSTGCHPCGCLRPEAAMPEEPTMPITVEVLEAEIEAGSVQAIPGDEVIARLRARVR